MEEAAASAGPQERNVLVRRWKSAEVGEQCNCSSGRRGRRAKRGAPGAHRRNLGVADIRQFRARDKDVSPCGPAGGR
eukprot:12377507-Alexandrium_andersonii.AAC.1